MSSDVRLSGAQTDPRTESDIRMNYNNLQQIIAASNVDATSSQAQFYSSDGGATWKQTLLPFTASDSNHTDPAVDWTSDGTAWAITIAIPNNQIRCYSSTDGGATWAFDGTPSGTQTTTDKELMWVDHSASSPHKDTIYVIWQKPAWVARRTAAGWQAPLKISGSETTGSTPGADIKTNSAGDVFAFWPDTGSGNLFVAKSTDGGASFAKPVKIAQTFGRFQVSVPADNGRKALIYLSGGAYKAGGTDAVYVAWADLSGDSGCTSGSGPGADATSACKTRVWFSRSTDGGATWSTPTKINDQSGKNDQFFPRLALDESSGDLMIVYYDTINDSSRVKTDLWMQSSTDGGASWSGAAQITSKSTDETSAGADGNQYGDYIGLTGYAGQFFACWTDRRSGGKEEIWGAPIALVQRAARLEIDRDHFGQDEVDAARTQPGGAVFKTAFRLAVDGFTARELGVTGSGSTGLAPAVTFSPSTGLKATCTSVDSTDPAFSPDVLQRIRFVYDLDFGSDDTAFTSFAGDSQTVLLSATFNGMPAAGQITLIKQPNPYILQGQDTWWLSSDVRVLQIVEDEQRFGVTMHNDPQQFIADLTAALESGQGHAGGESFDDNTSEQNEILTVSPITLRGFPPQVKKVYNFAVARVHYRGLNPADHVRVFFRLFAANSTSTDFHTDTTYRRDPSVYPVPVAQWGEHTIPTAGVQGSEYVTIPCFAAPREAANQAGAANSLPGLQQDAANVKPLAATGGPVHDVYYGAFLDINQPAAVFPSGGTVPAGNADGPWPSGSGVALEPVSAAFIRGEHQCLMAEIAFDPVPIATGTQPFNSDKLAQRNLSWSTVANPGVSLSRQALETFEVRPTPKSFRGGDDTPDELVIEWNDVPAGEHAEVYLPAVDADAVLARASRLYGTHRLSRVDANTIGCETGGVTYIPLPPGTGDGVNFAGLMSIGLPAGIKRGELYHVVVSQLTNAFAVVEQPPPPLTIKAEGGAGATGGGDTIRWRRVLGTFQINIPVSTKELMLETEELRYSIFQWIAATIPAHSRWFKVFRRYIQLLGLRVGELGGDPAHIKPSQNGYDGLPEGHGRRHRHHRHHEGRELTGKVEGVIYDHFGDFSGFILELRDGDQRHFESREREVEELVREAWAERTVITVVAEGWDDELVRAVILRR